MSGRRARVAPKKNSAARGRGDARQSIPGPELNGDARRLRTIESVREKAVGNHRPCDTLLNVTWTRFALRRPPCSMFQKETHIRVPYQMTLSDKAMTVPESARARSQRICGGFKRRGARRRRKRPTVAENADAQSERMDWASAFSDE